MPPVLLNLLYALALALLPLNLCADPFDPDQILYTKTFRVDPNPFVALNFPDLIAPSSTELVQAHLTKNGLSFPETGDGKKLFYNDRTGVLMVRATLAELDQVENALQLLNITPPQVQIEVKIAEYNLDDIPVDLPEHLQNIFSAAQEPQNLKAAAITTDETKLLLRVLEQTPVDLTSPPTITTLSGRQARIANEQQPPILTDPPFTAPGKEMKARWSR